MSTLAADPLVTMLRVIIGLLFIGHGAQKLFGWFGGGGFNSTIQMMEHLNMYPSALWAFVSSAGEFVGGVLLVLGLLTPVGAALIIGSMLVAIAKVHGPNGLWNMNKGFEFNLVLIANAIFIGLAGPGAYALDQLIHYPWSNTTQFLFSTAVALVGVFLAILISESRAAHRPINANPR